MDQPERGLTSHKRDHKMRSRKEDIPHCDPWTTKRLQPNDALSKSCSNYCSLNRFQ